MRRAGDDLIRVVYYNSGGVEPCLIELARSGRTLGLSMIAVFPGTGTDDLHQWCVEARVPAELADRRIVLVPRKDPYYPFPNQRSILETGRGCVEVPVRVLTG
jgi:hypothetical protein